MPRSLPPIHSPAPALTPSAAAHSLDPLEVAQRLARPELAAASQTDPSTLLVVDVRSRRQFARGHLPLSHPIPAAHPGSRRADPPHPSRPPCSDRQP